MNEQEQTGADIGQEQEQEQEQAAPTMADAARLLAVLAESRTDPMADQTTWTTYGVSDAEHAAIVAAAAMIGRMYEYRNGAVFTVERVADCRPATGTTYGPDQTVVSGRYHYLNDPETVYAPASTWTADLGAEVVR